MERFVFKKKPNDEDADSESFIQRLDQFKPDKEIFTERRPGYIKPSEL
jgi:hypothetical protein